MDDTDLLIQRFLQDLVAVWPASQQYSDQLQRACRIAQQAHDGQVRKSSGEPYLTHPLWVACDLGARYGDLDVVIAGILHDVVEDSETCIDHIYDVFGETVGFAVDAVTKNLLAYHQYPDHTFDDKIDKLLWGSVHDVRCLLVKLTDRKHNLDTLGALPPNKQVRMAFETQAIYEPLKTIFGIEGDSTVTTAQAKRDDYRKRHQLDTTDRIKQKLYNERFKNIDIGSFETMYGDSSAVIWRIEDIEWFEELIAQDSFARSVRVKSMGRTTAKTRVDFVFKAGHILNGNIGKLGVQGFSNAQ